MRNVEKVKKLNLLILIVLLLFFFLIAGPTIIYGENGQQGEGYDSPVISNSENIFVPMDSLLLYTTLSMII